MLIELGQGWFRPPSQKDPGKTRGSRPPGSQVPGPIKGVGVSSPFLNTDVHTPGHGWQALTAVVRNQPPKKQDFTGPGSPLQT